MAGLTGGPDGWVMSLPQPVVIILFALATVMFGGGFIMLSLMAVQKKPSFEINPDGVKWFGTFGREDRFLAWDRIREIRRVKSVLLFSGNGKGGGKITVAIGMMGHNKNTVVDVICANRPDFRAYL
jgi:hypothetical protein